MALKVTPDSHKACVFPVMSVLQPGRVSTPVNRTIVMLNDRKDPVGQVQADNYTFSDFLFFFRNNPRCIIAAFVYEWVSLLLKMLCVCLVFQVSSYILQTTGQQNKYYVLLYQDLRQ